MKLKQVLKYFQKVSKIVKVVCWWEGWQVGESVSDFKDCLQQ
jgi:hypothetical protein